MRTRLNYASLALIHLALACGGYEGSTANTGGLPADEPAAAAGESAAAGQRPAVTSEAGTPSTSVSEGSGGSAGDRSPTEGGSGGTSGGSGGTTGGTGGICTTYPPIWSDCDDDLQFVADTAAGGDGSIPLTLDVIDSPEEIAERVRDVARATLDTRYEQYWSSRLESNCRERTVCTGTGGVGTGGAAASMGGTVDTGMGGTADTSDPERSGTNNQVEGVDEPDLLKLDERYVYVIAENELLILDALDPATTSETSRVMLEGTPSRLLISGDRALVIASTGLNSNYEPCTYAYSCQFTGDGYGTLLTVFDISDPTSPRPLRRVELSGSYLSARRIGSNVHVVTSDVPNTPVIYTSTPYVNETSAADGLQALQDQYALAMEEIASAEVEVTLPTVTDEAIELDGTATSLRDSDYPDSLHATPGVPAGVLSIFSFDMESLAALHQDTIFTNPGAIYSSAAQLFVAVPELNTHYAGYGTDATWIHAFDLDEATATYAASGRVGGHVLNQFSMDQYDGSLRVATSSGWVPDPAVHSTVSILQQEGGRLELVGSIDDLAPGEDIRAVRFLGDRGYVVTFKKTDPLFVIDLADPTAPAVLGELKIPGFSTYLHPLGDNHLLSIGYDADEMGSFAYFDGIQLQIMEVSDPAEPTLVHREIIGTRGSSSEALTDHLAFNYFPTREMLAIPVTVCEGGGNGTYGDVLTFTGLMVYDVSVETGFALHGRVPHPAPTEYYSTYSTSCSTWWTNASSTVKRSAFIEDYIFSLGEAVAKVSPLADLEQDVAVFPVGPVPCAALDEADCAANAGCAAIAGTTLTDEAVGFVGCTTIPAGQSALSCLIEPTCAQDPVSGSCATLTNSCAPDGWITLGSGECTAATCGLE